MVQPSTSGVDPPSRGPRGAVSVVAGDVRATVHRDWLGVLVYWVWTERPGGTAGSVAGAARRLGSA